MPFMWAHWLCQCAQTSAAVLLAGTAMLRVLAWGTGVERFSSWTWLTWTNWSVLLCSAVLTLGFTAADMSGLPLAQACSRTVLGSVLESTTFGTVWKARMGLLAATMVVDLSIGRVPRDGGRTRISTILDVASALLTAALLATLILSGHAHASAERAWLLPSDLLHVLAAGAWPGGLLPLALLLARARHDPNLVTPVLRVTRRFSRLSVVAVSTLAVSGLLNSIGLVGTLSALWTSAYGRLILCKVALFAGMIGLGAVNRRMIRQKEVTGAGQTLRTVWRNVAIETALVICVLLATEALAMNAPPASESKNRPMVITNLPS
jgi:putative copper resistance protein D